MQRFIFIISSIIILLLLLLVATDVVTANNQLSRRRSAASTQRKNASQRRSYDRSVTTFDPDGQLLQVQYAVSAATKRTKRTMLAMIDHHRNTIYIATTTLVGTPQQPQPQPHQFVHLLTKGIYFVGIGLMGDIRALVSHLRGLAQQHEDHYQERMSVHEMARAMAQLQHACTYQSGIRPLGLTAWIFGIDHHNNNDDDDDDDDDDDSGGEGKRANRNSTGNMASPRPWKFYQCTPDGSVPEDCSRYRHENGVSYTVAGYQQETVLQHLQNIDDDIGNDPKTSSASSRSNTDTATSSCTNHIDEGDRMMDFVSTIRKAWAKMDGPDHEQQSRMMDVYVFRDRRCSSSSSRKFPTVTCFANMDYSAKNDHFHPTSLQRVRQYFNKKYNEPTVE
jgi:Proteasome subunit/Proteasome subunit A N-terminal signature